MGEKTTKTAHVISIVFFRSHRQSTDIKRQPEVRKETVVVPDEDYPIPDDNIKRNQVAPGRTKTC